MAYKKNGVVRFVSNQPDVHIQEMFGGKRFNPDDIEPREFVGRVKSVIDDGSAYVVDTLSPLKGFICIINADEIIGQVAVSDLDEAEKRAYNLRSANYEAPNVYDNDPCWLEESLSLEEKCKEVAALAMAELFPDTVVKEYDNFGLYDIRKERYIEILDFSIEHADTKSERRRNKLKRKRDELASFIQRMRFKEYYILLAGVEEDDKDAADRAFDSNLKIVCRYWWVAIDKNFEEVSIMRDIEERSHFFMFLGVEHQQIEDAIHRFAFECYT